MKMKRRVVILNDSAKMTGLGRYADYLSKALGAELISLRKDKDIPIENYSGTVISGFFPPFFQSGWYLNQNYPSVFMRKAYKHLKKNVEKTDVLHYSSHKLRPLKLNCDSVVSILDLFPIKTEYNYSNSFRRTMAKSITEFKKFDNILTISNHVRTQLLEEGFPDSVRVIYPPVAESFERLDVDKSVLRKKLNLPADKKLVLSVSTLDPRKNLKAVEETMSILGSDFRLVRIGKPLNQSFTFQKIDDLTVNELYNVCDVLLFPSIDEGFGYPIAEAFTTGLPVVCSDIEVFREIAEGAAVISSTEPIQLKKAVLEAVEKSEELSELGYLIKHRYSFETFKKGIGDYYAQTFPDV